MAVKNGLLCKPSDGGRDLIEFLVYDGVLVEPGRPRVDAVDDGRCSATIWHDRMI